MERRSEAHEHQLTLPLTGAGDTGRVDNGSCFRDPAFSVNKNLHVHRWVPWIAGFSSEFVRDALYRHLRKKGVVLDPFCGVGTTLVEALLAGHDALGFEINPYAAMACQIKSTAHRLDLAAMEREMPKFRDFYRQKAGSGYVPLGAPPKGFRTRATFYSPRVLRKVLIVRDFITTIQDCTVRDVFRLAFGSTMVRYSNYSYEPSLGRRASAGKEDIYDFDVGRTISLKLGEMVEDVRWLKSNMPTGEPRVQTINDSFFKYRKYMPAQSIDLVVTSPPYLNNYHYNRNTRPHLYWLGYVREPSDLASLEQANFGKYWQTVRHLQGAELAFSLPETDLEDRLEAVRQMKPERGVYGGRGWANYATEYFNDCYRFTKRLKYALRRGGTALVVIGNSILQGVLIPTDQYLGKIAELSGLELVGVHIPRPTRVGNSIIRSGVRVAKAKRSQELYEAVVELRRR